MRLRCECFSLLVAFWQRGKAALCGQSLSAFSLRSSPVVLFHLFLRFLTGKLMHTAILG